MGFPFDCQLSVQALLYFTVAACGLVTSIPIGVTTVNFKGHCLLNSGGSWTNVSHFQFRFGTSSLCDFVTFLNVIASILYGVGMGVYYTYAVCKKDAAIGRQMWIMPFILINSLITVLVFISSIIVSAGLSNFCSDLTSMEGNKIHDKGCASTQNETIFKWYDPQNPGDTYNGTTWHTYYSVASSAYWFCFLFWLIQTAFCILRWYRNRRERSGGDMSRDVTTSDKAEIVTNEAPSHPM